MRVTHLTHLAGFVSERIAIRYQGMQQGLKTLEMKHAQQFKIESEHHEWENVRHLLLFV